MDIVDYLNSLPRVRHIIHYMDKNVGNGGVIKGHTKVLLDKEAQQPNFGQPLVKKPKREDNRWYWYSKEDRARINKKRRELQQSKKEELLQARLQRIKQQENDHGNSK